MKPYWDDNFKKVIKNHEGIFGHNIILEKKYFVRLHKITSNMYLKFTDYYSAVIVLPKNENNDPIKLDEKAKVLQYLLTETPMPTVCKYRKKTNSFVVEWHY